MARRCQVCDHHQLREIEADMTAGMGVVPMEAKYDISKSTLSRHRANCLHPRLVAATRMTTPVPDRKAEKQRAKAIAAGEVPSPAEVLSLTGLLDRLVRSLERLEGAADGAAADGLPTALAAVSGQLHKGIEVAARLQGLDRPAEAPRTGYSIQIIMPEGFQPDAPQHERLTIEGRAAEPDVTPDQPVGLSLPWRPGSVPAQPLSDDREVSAVVHAEPAPPKARANTVSDFTVPGFNPPASQR